MVTQALKGPCRNCQTLIYGFPGQSVRCPACGLVNVVPGPAAGPAPSPGARAAASRPATGYAPQSFSLTPPGYVPPPAYPAGYPPAGPPMAPYPTGPLRTAPMALASLICGLVWPLSYLVDSLIFAALRSG